MTSIFYITQINFLSGRAHVYNIAKTCEALAKLDETKITIVSCDGSLRSEDAKERFFAKHNVKTRFNIISLNSLSNYLKNSRLLTVNRLAVVFSNFSLIRLLFKKRKQIDVIYFRDHLLFLAVIFGKYFLKKPVFYESHYVLKKKHGQFLTGLSVRISDGVITISHELKKYYQKLNSNIAVAFCGAAEMEKFDYSKSKKALRTELNLPIDKFIAGYVGNLGLTGNYDIYRIDKIIEALQYLPNDVIFVGVGDKSGDSKNLRKLSEKIGVSDRVVLLPWQERENVPLYLLSFDVLVLPRRSKDMAGDSPIKMFEYLAAKRPIIAASSPTIKEVMENGVNSLVVKSDISEEWARAIDYLRNNDKVREDLSLGAFNEAKKHNWRSRAQIIFSFTKKIKR